MSRSRKHKSQNLCPAAVSEPEISVQGQKRFQWFAIAVILLFGIYQSIIFFGYRVVPNSDFPAFVGVARQILSFDLPGNFKRLPGLGILQIGLSNFTTGIHPVLTAGWLLNAILHPISLVLLYLIAKRIISKAAFWFVLIVAVNPWTIELLSQPMAETTLLCFSLLTFYLILVRSNLCYVAACAATLIRYDAAALIVAAMFADVFENRQKKQLLLTLLRSALAFTPLAMWLIATRLNWQTSSKGHYLSHYTSAKHIGIGYLDLLWQTAFGSLLQLPSWVNALFVKQPSAGQIESLKQATGVLFGISKLLVAVGVFTAAARAVIKKNLQLMPVLVYMICNLAVQMMRMKSTPRYCFVLVWITVLLCCYGWQIIFKAINKKQAIPLIVSIVFYAITIIASAVWIGRLMPALANAAKASPAAASLLTASILAIVLFAPALIFANNKKQILKTLAITAFMGLMLFSNHFSLAKTIGDGKRDAEFRMLAEWFAENSQPGDKLVTSMPGIVKIFIPDRKADIVHVSSIGGKDASQFVADCYKKGITHVAWDSRVGLRPTYSYYKQWRINRIDRLRAPRNNDPYEFVGQVGQNKMMYINIFRLKKPSK